MPEIKLSKRLSSISLLIPKSGGVADVGTDHGYIPVWLRQKGCEGKIYATDINPGPLARARAHAHEHGVDKDISFLLCDGLAGVSPDEVQTVVIAGMGGETIAGILSAAPWTGQGGRLLILQPMTKSDELRLWLFENGYEVLSERLAEDGKLYEILTARGGADRPYTPAELLTGHTELIGKDRLYAKQLDALISKLARVRDGLKSSSRQEDKSRLRELEEILSELRGKRENTGFKGGTHGKG